MSPIRWFPIAIAAAALAACTPDGGDGRSARDTNAAPRGASIEPYLYDKCLVIALPLDFHGKEIRRVYDGREVKFCCRPCVKTFNDNPEIWMAKLDRLNAGTETFPEIVVPPPHLLKKARLPEG